MTTEKSSDNLGNQPSDNEKLMLSMIRDILLREDREDIAVIKESLDDNEKLAERINPIIEIHVESLKRKFPKEYRKQVDRIVEQKLKDSQDDLLDVIYPVMGKMIRKYINHQFLELKENLDQRVGRVFSFKAWVGRVKGFFTGVNESEMAMRDYGKASIEEVFIIQRDSGILLGDYSKNETIDRDIIAGMITAIKSFVEDAFNKEKQELELIDYGTYKIFIQSFHQYYFSIILDGTISTSERDELSVKLLDFAENHISPEIIDEIEESGNTDILSSRLRDYFI